MLSSLKNMFVSSDSSPKNSPKSKKSPKKSSPKNSPKTAKATPKTAKATPRKNNRPQVKPSTLTEGKKMKGGDGKEWVVCVGAKGNYWKRIVVPKTPKTAKVTPKTAKSSPKTKTAKATPKTAKSSPKKRSPKPGLLTGQVICLTGRMWTNRDGVEKVITDNGGKVTKNISKKNTILVVGSDVTEDNNKLKKTTEFNVRRMNANDFQKYVSSVC